jgi:transcriptional regulator with XRE-family HTH domain
MTAPPDAVTVQAAAAQPRSHGTYSRYRYGPDENGEQGACRCARCKAASARVQRDRYRLKAYGRWESPYTDAGPSRDHVRALRAAGVSRECVARVTGVSDGALTRLLYGRRDRPPTRMVRRETEARILAVRPSLDLLADGAPVDSAGTVRRLQALIATGRTRQELAGRLGVQPTNLTKLMAGRQVRAATARAARALYDELWDVAPDEGTPRAALLAARTRRGARNRGWALPAAWDDDTIDDPAAGPAEGWQRRGGDKHRDSAALVEDASELIDGTAEREGQGYTRATAAMRLGVSLAALEKAYERTGRLAAAAATEGESHAAA